MARPMTDTVSARYEFTDKELADLGAELAGVYQERAKLDEDKKSMTAQLKERETSLETKVGSLSRQISSKFEMRTYECTLRWDDPNVGEVSYYRQDNGALIKSRAMTVVERQLDLPLQTEEQTKNNVVSFFKKGGEVVEGGKDVPEGETQPQPPAETETPQDGAVAEPEGAVKEPPVGFEGSLEEYHAQTPTEAIKEATDDLQKSGVIPARKKRPKKTD